MFHPPYIRLHLGVAKRMQRSRLAVLKGGGGEAERNPFKPVVAHLWRDGSTAEIALRYCEFRMAKSHSVERRAIPPRHGRRRPAIHVLLAW